MSHHRTPEEIAVLVDQGAAAEAHPDWEHISACARCLADYTQARAALEELGEPLGASAPARRRWQPVAGILTLAVVALVALLGTRGPDLVVLADLDPDLSARVAAAPLASMLYPGVEPMAAPAVQRGTPGSSTNLDDLLARYRQDDALGLRIQLLTAFLADDRVEDAKLILRNLSPDDRARPDVALLTAQVAFRESRLEAARGELERAAGSDLGQLAEYNLALVDLAAGDPASAAQRWRGLAAREDLPAGLRSRVEMQLARIP